MATERSGKSARFNDVRRAAAITKVLAKYGFGHLLRTGTVQRVDRPGQPLDALQNLASTDATRATSATVRFRRLLEELGPTFIKIGQLMSTRADIVPEGLARELEILQDRAEPVPYARVKAQLEDELETRIEDAFAWFDETPLATASIAQVHRATLREGDELVEVVCKIQRPGIESTVRADLSLLHLLARAFDSVIDGYSVYSFPELVHQLRDAIISELDFVRERKHMELARRNFGKDSDLLEVPEPMERLSTNKVLTMTFLEGVRVTDALDVAGHHPTDLRDRLLEIGFRQVFEHGHFHGDPHPGNVLVMHDGRIALLDYGCWGVVHGDQQDAFMGWLAAIATKNPTAVTRMTQKIGRVPEGFDRERYEQDVRRMLDSYVGHELADVRTDCVIRDVVELIRRHNIKVPAELIGLIRATGTFEGVMRQLFPELDFREFVLPYVQRWVMRRIDSSLAGAHAMDVVWSVQEVANDAPTQMRQLLGKLNSGNFQVDVRGDPLRQLSDEFRAGTRRLSWSILAGAILIALASVSPNLRTDRFGSLDGPVLALVGVVVSGFVVYAAVRYGMAIANTRGQRSSE